LLLLFVFLLAAVDLDRDGLDDRLEQELLQRFLPDFRVHRKECDALPAEFAPNEISPRAIARNGVIYGRVVPRRAGEVAIQYFHLWSRDCGLFPHRLDVEHVTAIVQARDLKQPARHWKAVSWFASAHGDTLCDNSEWMPATALQAESRGPRVWISRGKHASYFDLERCARGCRTDDCHDSEPMAVRRVVNLGEPHSPLNGCLFIHSRRWRFHDKLNQPLAPS
jgi:hypothetical protein